MGSTSNTTLGSSAPDSSLGTPVAATISSAKTASGAVSSGSLQPPLAIPPGAARSIFWFCSQPLIESSLVLASGATGAVQSRSLIRVRDADGAVVNEVTLSHCGLALFDLASAVLNVKLEGGLRHGTVEVFSPARATMRMFNKGFSRFFEPARSVTLECAQFAPVTLASHVENLICLLNTSGQEATVRVRLILARRNPDTLVSVPPFGARVISIEREFGEVISAQAANNEAASRAYVRVSLRTDHPLMMQGVEVIGRAEGAVGAGAGVGGGASGRGGAVGNSGVVQVCPL